MPIPIPTKPRIKHLLPCLLACGGLGLGNIPAHSQPPAPATQTVVDSIEQDWQDLQKTMGAQELQDPQSTITRYQKFYETEGYRSGQTAVEITGIIAQLYWQGLNNPPKALAIYDWGIKQLAQYPGINLLQQGRDVVAESGAFSNTFDVQPVIIAAPPVKVLSPVTLDNKADSTNGTNPLLTPVIVTPSADANSDLNPIKIPAANSTVPAKVLSPVMSASPSAAPLWNVAGVDPHLLALSSAAAAMRAGKMTAEEVYARAGNADAEKLFQKVLQSQRPAGAWWDPTSVRSLLASFYASQGNFDKAAQTQLQIAATTAAPADQANTSIEAARFYMQAGETDKAQALYEKAQKSSFGWAAGMVLVDQGNELIAQGNYDEAIRVLSQPVKGRYADQMKVGMLSTLGYAYLQKGDIESARRVSQQAVDDYQKLTNPLQGEGLQEVEESAQERVRLIDKWKDQLFVLPLKSLLAKRDEQDVYHATLYVQSFIKAQPVTVRFENPAVQLVALTLQKQHRTEQGVMVGEYEITYKIAQHPADLKALVTATSNPKEQQSIDIRYIDEEN